MSDNPIVVEALQELAKGAANLNLSHGRINAEDCKTLALALADNTTLTLLNLYVNEVGPEGAAALAEALETNSALTTLNLYKNKVCDVGVEALAEALKVNTSLAVLNLYGNKISATSMEALANGLQVNTSLQKLELRGNQLGDEGVAILSDFLRVNASLKDLNLADNSLGDEGMQPLADALMENTSLTNLNLYGNDIQSEGIVMLSEAIKVNTTLQWLGLTRNDIGADGAVALAEALKENSSLTWLSLYSNDIGTRGALSLAAVLKTDNRSLTSLNLFNNRIGEEGGEAFLDALQENTSLLELDLGDNKIDPVDGAQIKAFLQQNNERQLPEDNQSEKWLAAVRKAIENNDEHAWGRVKLMVVGQGAAGKTSTVRSLLGLPFDTAHASTEVADLHRTRAKDFAELPDDVGEFDMQVRKAAMRRLRPLAEPKHKSLRRRVINSMQRSLSRATSSFSLLAATSNSSLPTVEAISSTPMLSEEETARRFELTSEDQEFLQSSYTSNAKLDFDVSFTIWDYGGQEVFYALHHIFLTDNGLYLVVFDMAELKSPDGQGEAIQTLKFWLKSIRLHAPYAPIALIGTHLDQIDQADLSVISSIIRNKVQIVEYPQCMTGPKGRPFFPINNSVPDKDQIAELRKRIVNVALDQVYVREQVPLAWLKIYEDLMQCKKQYVLSSDVAYIAWQYGQKPGQVSEMLRYFHEAGVVVYLEASEELQHIVVIDPQWLLDKLARVIADDAHVESIYETGELVEAGLEAEFVEMRRKAIATRRLLEFLWNDEEVDYLIAFMRENMLLSTWDFNPRETTYLISGLISDMMEPIDTSRFTAGCVCELDFSSTFLPTGVFQRLVAQCAHYSTRPEVRGDWPLTTPEVGRNSARMAFGQNNFVIEVIDNRIRFRIYERATAPAMVIKFLVSMFRQQQQSFFSKLSWDLYLCSTKGDWALYSKIEGDRQSNQKYSESVDGVFVDLSDYESFFDEKVGRLDTDEDGLVVPHYDIPPLIASEKTHLFLSHIEKTGGSIAEALEEKLSRRGLKVWLSQKFQGNLNRASMVRGVKETHTFVLILTKDVFSSAAVCDELQTAITEEKNIVLVHESETHREGYFPIVEYKPLLPSFCRTLLDDINSMPIRRRYYEEEAFLKEFIRRCIQPY